MYDPSSAASAQAREVVQLLRAQAAEEASCAETEAATRAELAAAEARAAAEAQRADDLRNQLVEQTRANAELMKSLQMALQARSS